MSKFKKVASTKLVINQMPATSPHDLPQLSAEEAQKAYNRARIAGNIHEPENLRTVWTKKMEAEGQNGVGELLRLIRAGVNSPEMDKPEQTAAYLARLLQAAIECFETLVQNGAMDEVLPRLTALPVLYSLQAGKGAREWERASEVFKEKKVGTKSVSAHMGSSPAAARNPIWGMLAAEAAQLAYLAAVRLPIFDDCKAKAKAFGDMQAKRPGARYAWVASIYLLADNGVLIWPDWLEACRGLPQSVKDNVDGYQAACGLIMKDFFGDPGNSWASVILTQKTQTVEINSDGRKVKTQVQTSAAARKEAVKNVVKAVGRLWV